MPQLTPYLLGGLIAAFAMDALYGVPSGVSSAGHWHPGSLARDASPTPNFNVNRSIKSDRLDIRMPSDKNPAVAAIRDSESRNVTVMKKNRLAPAAIHQQPKSTAPISVEGKADSTNGFDQKRAFDEPAGYG